MELIKWVWLTIYHILGVKRYAGLSIGCSQSAKWSVLGPCEWRSLVSLILLFYYSVKETSSLNTLLEHFLDPVKGDPLMRYRLIN